MSRTESWRLPHAGMLGRCWWKINLRGSRPRRNWRRVVLALAGVWKLARPLEAFAGPDHPYSHLAPLAGLALSCSILWGIFERAHRVPRSPGTALAASFIAYLVIAIAFAQLYWTLNRVVTPAVQPGHSHAGHHYPAVLQHGDHQQCWLRIFAPVNPDVRVVAAIESLTDLVYIAVVVARLVSSYHESEDHALG